MSAKNVIKWFVNIVLFLLFLAAFFLDLTGVLLHQWMGLFIGALALFHLLNHWQWVKAVTERFFQASGKASRFNYILDASLAAGMTAIILSGLIISTWFGINGPAFSTWRFLHILVSISALIILFVKLLLHWKCINGALRQFFLRKPLQQPITLPGLQCENPAAISRRDALRTMGAISLGGAVILIKAVTSLDMAGIAEELSGQKKTPQLQSSAEASVSIAEEQSIKPAPLLTATPGLINTTNCIVRCPNGCTYPGLCRRYTDGNKNGRCDLGECL